MDEVVIFSYTDKQAVEDGVLVDTGRLPLYLNGEQKVNRITIGLWLELKEAYTDHNSTSPVETYFLKMSKDICEALANRVEEGTPGAPTGVFFLIPPSPLYEKTLWCIKNETGGFTLMRPEDY